MKMHDSLANRLLSQDRRALAQAITLVESQRPDHQEEAQTLLEGLPIQENTFRIGISGIPGVGKSTFIDAFGSFLIEKGNRVAVLAIDPSSPLTHGSILADKTRMQRLAASPEAFIRPTPSGGILGGVAAKTRDVLFLCESAGFNIILIETVGIGQSETEVFGLTDAVILLLPPAAGDELQGLKKGIIEIADLLLINKNDSGLESVCDQTFQAYSSALKLSPARSEFWTPTVHKVSALHGKGLEETWEDLKTYQKKSKESGSWIKRRRHQATLWLEEEIRSELWKTFQEKHMHNLKLTENEIGQKHISPSRLAKDLVKHFMS
jgi:LAO/AO transport system kinase